jgi:transcriptional repressor NF-X1
MALNIDPATHADDHVPYSQETLNLYKELPVKWSQTQEREIRVFAADENEKRLRFQPMKASHRAFIHSLAQDFGLDSESMDPEPHRHVILLKTPKFVSSPLKTLGQCVKLRRTAESMVVAPKKKANIDPFNAFVLTSPRFALTIEEVKSAFAPHFSRTPDLSFEISFLPSEEIVVKAVPTAAEAPTEEAISGTLMTLKPLLSQTSKSHDLAKVVNLCRVDSSLNILRREEDPAASGGWSQVAAKSSAPIRVPREQSVGVKSQFTVLGNLRAKKEKAKREKEEEERKRLEAENAPDSWEDAEEEAEMGEAKMEEAEMEEAEIGEAKMREAEMGEAEMGEAEMREAEMGEAEVTTPVATNEQSDGEAAPTEPEQVEAEADSDASQSSKGQA